MCVVIFIQALALAPICFLIRGSEILGDLRGRVRRNQLPKSCFSCTVKGPCLCVRRALPVHLFSSCCSNLEGKYVLTEKYIYIKSFLLPRSFNTLGEIRIGLPGDNLGWSVFIKH